MTKETELPAVKVKASIPAAEEITADWGERCPDFEPGCFCCQMWAMHDEITALRARCEKAEAERDAALKRSADYPTISAKLHDREKAREAEQRSCSEAIARATAAESRCEELVKALEPFELMSTEGVVKHTTNYITVTTVSDYFHTAARVVASYRKRSEADGK
jgi:hypothetical protein